MLGAMGLEETTAALQTCSQLYFMTGAAVCKTAVAPIDRVKLLMQSQGEGGMVKAGRFCEPYKGIGNCFGRTLIEEGFASLWRGNAVNVARYLPSQAFTFGLWELTKHHLARYFNEEENGYSLWCVGNFSAGSVAGAYATLFFYPMDYARSRLAMDAKKGGESQFKGLLDLYAKTMAADGVAGFYRGVLPSFAGAFAYRGLYFGMYESLKPVVLTGTMQDGFFGSFGLAWMSALVAGSVSYPLDTLRRRLMMEPGEYKAVSIDIEIKRLYTILDSIANEGLKSVFKGFGANMLRSIAGAAVLVAYDKASSYSIQMKKHVPQNVVKI